MNHVAHLRRWQTRGLGHLSPAQVGMVHQGGGYIVLLTNFASDMILLQLALLGRGWNARPSTKSQFPKVALVSDHPHSCCNLALGKIFNLPASAFSSVTSLHHTFTGLWGGLYKMMHMQHPAWHLAQRRCSTTATSTRAVSPCGHI